MEDKIVTTFQLPLDQKEAFKLEAGNHEPKLSVSEYLAEKVRGFLLTVGDDGLIIPKLKKNSETNLVYTSVLIPRSLRNQARWKAMDSGVSLGDLFRYCLTTDLSDKPIKRARIKEQRGIAA